METAVGRFWPLIAAAFFAFACSGSEEPAPPVGPADDASTSDRTDGPDQKPDVSEDAPGTDATPGDDGPQGDGGADAPSDTPTDLPLPCAPCPSGVCLDASTCAECVADRHCSGASPRCNTATNSCVACLPGTTDNCPAGQYCTATFACVPGCKGNTSCASGACTTGHDCERCVSDLECGGGRVCGTGTCGATCAVPTDCTGGYDCCTSHCVDRTRDIAHCGACGTACQLSEFCGTGGCNVVSIANICAHAKTTAILDGLTPDDTANLVVQNAIVANCMPAPQASSSAVGSSAALNPTTGQPVIGGNNLLTATGGPFVQKIVSFLETSGASPVRLVSMANEWQYRDRTQAADAGSSGMIVASLPFTQFTPTHDIFVIELVRDPISGTLSLVLFGQQAETTTAAAWYFANVILPNRATYPKSWYVYEWTGASDAGPSGADTFQLRASGP